MLNTDKDELTWKLSSVLSLFLGLLASTLLLFLVFWKIILSPGYVSYGDNTFYFDKAYISSWSPYFGNGIPRDSVISPLGYSSIAGVLHLFGIGSELASKVIFFLPLVLCVLSLLIVLERVSGSILFSFAGVVLFFFLGISLEYLLFFPNHYFLSISSLLFSLLLVYRIFDSKNNGQLLPFILIILLSILNFHPFFFIIYTLHLVFYLLFLVFKRGLTLTVIRMGLAILFTIVINMYWILPFIAGILSDASNPEVVYGVGNLEAVSSAYIRSSSINSVITGSTYPIHYSRNIINRPVTTLLSFLLLALALYDLSLLKKNGKVYNTYLITTILIFLGLSFWPTNIMFKSIWDILWNNLDIFKFFRSFNRFAIFFLPLILFSIGINYKFLRNKRFLSSLLVLMVTLVLFERRNLLSGDLGGFISIYKIPSEYYKLNSYLRVEDKGNSRIISYPRVDYEVYHWNRNSNYENFPQTHYLMEVFMNGVVLQSKAANHIFLSNPFYKNIFDPENCNKDKKNFLEDLSKIDIGYIMLHKDFIDQKGNVTYATYEKCLDESYFTQIFDNEYFGFYRVKYDPKYTKNYEIKQIYPFHYEIEFDFKGKDTGNLIFPQNFNSRWKLYIDNLGGSYNFMREYLIPFYSKELRVENNDNDPGNKWLLERNEFSDDKIKLHLYYYSQIYVFIGSAITVITLFSVLSFGVITLVGNSKNKKILEK